MQHLSRHLATQLSFHTSVPARRPGERSGEGADSALPPLHDDRAQHPDRPRPADTHPGADRHEHGNDAPDFIRPRQVGRYLVSPLIKQTEAGTFTISVSIRSGSGSATTDRVLRLTGVFPCPIQAAEYARSEALQWITPPARSPGAT